MIRDIGDVTEKGIYFYPVNNDTLTTDPSFFYVQTAVAWALKNKVGGIVTAPISKEKWLKAGIKFSGHTGYLAESAGVEQMCMFFWSLDLRVALFTTHIPLNRVFSQIKEEKIIPFIRFVEQEVARLFSRRFKILVCGLNPHAGENGYLGREEVDIIIPAIEKLKPEMDIEGPYPPDVIFIKAREIEHSIVISWYHDQGLIPFKLLNINSGVNMTLGLPYIRTSPDHGTAYDIAGKGIANPSSMMEALNLAVQLVG